MRGCMKPSVCDCACVRACVSVCNCKQCLFLTRYFSTLQKKADEAGVIFSNSDGDQPGVIMNLYRWVKAIGLRPILCGNIKGFHNVRRNPETQAEFARATKQNPMMVTSFCDGTKVRMRVNRL